mgnify:CR=1 FL=1
MRLSLVANKPLSKGMIIFFDEIQEVKDFIRKWLIISKKP